MTAKERIDQHDREIAAIRKLILTGMKMLVRLEKSQQTTDAQLQSLIRSLKGGGNGHSRH